MNKHILMVIDNQLNPDKHTKAQLEQNYADADATAYAAHAAHAAAAAATYADAGYVAADQTDAYWLDKYFKNTGENKQDYIDVINKDNKL